MAPWTAARQTSLSCTIFRSLLEFMSNESVMPSSHLILCHPLLLLPSVFPSISFGSSHQVAKILALQHQSLSSEYSGLISVGYLELMDTPPHCSPSSKHTHALLQQWKAPLGRRNQSRDVGSIVHPETPVNTFLGMLTQLIRDAGGTVKYNREVREGTVSFKSARPGFR